jgi:flagellar protein FliL
MKKSVLLIIALASLLLLGGGGGWWWWQSKAKAATAAGQPAKPAIDKTDYRYITLDKVIVMLRNANGDSGSHYLAVDLVFKTAAEHERMTKDHLPLLRSVAVKALSGYTLETASQLTIDQVTNDVNNAFTKSYAADQREKPFALAMIGKLIIE